MVSFTDVSKFFLKQIKNDPKAAAIRIKRYILFQKKTQDTISGKLIHSSIFFSFLVLLAGTTIVAIDKDIVGKIWGVKILKDTNYLLFEFILDTAGIVFLFGLAASFCRRIALKPSYLHTEPADYWILGLFLFILLSGFIVEALRLQLGNVSYAKFSYVGNFLKIWLFKGIETESGVIIYRTLWFVHCIAAMSFIAVIPFTKLRHFLFIPVNLLLYPPKAYDEKAKLSTPFNILEIDENDDEIDESMEKIGVGSLEDMEWHERLQIYSCINCGRCEDACPAHNSGRLLSPRNIIQKIGKEISTDKNSEVLFENTILHEELWGCTNCYACTEVCPSFIRHVDHFINFRRFVVNSGFEDEGKISILGNIDRNGNPYGLPSYSRAEWLEAYNVPTAAEKDEIEYLYFIGCASSYDQRCQQITKSVINILNHAGIDFAILGEEERCCGEPAKRMGEEGLFQMTAMQNIELFESYGAKNVLVHCPHCYNMLKHEYKDFNGNYNVIHHTELINDLFETGRIRLNNSDRLETITFHDPCNLGRLNGIFKEPRNILKNFGKLREMNRCREESFCCGGGGGNAFYKINEAKRMSQIRIEEALKTNASTIAAACPFCVVMFEDVMGNLAKEKRNLQLRDIAEIVSERLENK